jgi:hypothetical protein
MGLALWFAIWSGILACVACWIVLIDPGNWLIDLVAFCVLLYAAGLGLRACDIYMTQQREERPDVRQRYLDSRLLYSPRPRDSRRRQRDD